MTGEEKTKERLEIAHVLFIDIVGYSRLLLDEQGEALHELNARVRGTETVRTAGAAGQLVLLPTGDGMALVFSSSVEAPADCALQLSQAVRAQPGLRLRMGIHSGAVQHVEDVNGRANIAGSGINVAQRVMDCGDAGHILVSKRVADDLAGSRRWQPYLHELGEVEVKHGLVLSLVNLYADAVGNPEPPGKLNVASGSGRWLLPGDMGRSRLTLDRPRWIGAGVVALAVVLAGVGWWRVAHDHVPEAVVAAPSAPQVASTVPVSSAPDKSIAVLPFETLSADKDNAYFADGMQDEILTNLAKVADLKVISRTSVMQYRSAAARNLREVGLQLGVAHVLEGSVQRLGNKVRVSAQLIDTRTDAHLWAERYDRDLADVFAIQSEIAQAIAAQLRAVISPQERAAMTEPPTRDLEAYSLYLQARQALTDFTDLDQTRKFYEQALRLLDTATTRDPRFIRAYAAAVYIQCQLYQDYETNEDQATVVRDLVTTMERLRPGSGEAHYAAGLHDRFVRLEYESAQEHFAAAVRLLPNDADAWIYLAGNEFRLGRWADALAHFRKAAELDPNNDYTVGSQAVILIHQRRYPEALAVFDHRLASRQIPLFQVLKAQLLMEWKADLDAASAALANVPAGIHLQGGTVQAQLFHDYCARDFAAAARHLAACPLAEMYPDRGHNGFVPRSYYEGLLARYRGDGAAAASALSSARAALAQKTRANPMNMDELLALATVDAALGHTEDALAEGRRALVLGRADDDARLGPVYTLTFARVQTWVGKRDEAIRTLQALATKPGGPSYGYLKLHPDWDALRGDPRFEALVASLAPK